jgi:hypothetical protein
MSTCWHPFFKRRVGANTGHIGEVQWQRRRGAVRAAKAAHGLLAPQADRKLSDRDNSMQRPT